MFKKLLRASAIYGIGPELPKVINLIMLPIITPYLGPEDYGHYGVITAYLGLFSVLKELGLSVIINNTFFKYRRRYKFTWSRLYGFLTIWNIVLSLLIAAILYLIFPESQQHHYALITLLYCLPIAFFSSTIFIGRKNYHLNQQPVPYVSISIVSSLVIIASNYITIVIFQMGYVGWFVSYFFGNLSTFIIYFTVVFIRMKLKPSFAFNVKWIKRQLKVSLPVIPHFYSSYLISTSDRIVLDYYKIPINDIGLYNLGYNLGNYFNVVGMALGVAAGPIFLKYYSEESMEGEKHVKNLTLLMQIGMVSLGFMAAIWIKEFFAIFIKNDSLSSAYLFTVFVIMSFTLRPLYLVPNLKLQYLERTKGLWKISFVAGIINLILNFFLIPLIGTWGAVVSTFASMIYLALSGFFLKDYKISMNGEIAKYPTFWVVIVLLSTFLAYQIIELSIDIKILITLGVLSVGFFNRKRLGKLTI